MTNNSTHPISDSCPHCAAKYFTGVEWECGTTPIIDGDTHRSPLCIEREARQKAEDLIEGLHEGWKKARKAHLETCKNAQAEINKLHTENVCLQELIQEFYEWTRRDYPAKQEVREIMNRYHDLLNK